MSRLLGGLAAVTGALDDATRHFEGALADHERWGAAAWGARTRHEYASVLRARGREGDADRAEVLREEALRAASDLGMDRLRDQILVPVAA